MTNIHFIFMISSLTRAGGGRAGGPSPRNIPGMCYRFSEVIVSDRLLLLLLRLLLLSAAALAAASGGVSWNVRNF